MFPISDIVPHRILVNIAGLRGVLGFDEANTWRSGDLPNLDRSIITLEVYSIAYIAIIALLVVMRIRAGDAWLLLKTAGDHAAAIAVSVVFGSIFAAAIAVVTELLHIWPIIVRTKVFLGPIGYGGSMWPSIMLVFVPAATFTVMIEWAGPTSRLRELLYHSHKVLALASAIMLAVSIIVLFTGCEGDWSTGFVLVRYKNELPIDLAYHYSGAYTAAVLSVTSLLWCWSVTLLGGRQTLGESRPG